MKNLFSKLKLLISHPKGRKELYCKKYEFCNCEWNLEWVCLNCGDKKRIGIHVCGMETDESL